MNNPLKKLLRPLASLKLTVVLFGLAMFLIFAGTLAQVHQGIWTVMGLYFRSFVVWIDLQLFAPTKWVRLPGRFPFPGGFTVGGLLMINLVAAHTVRFKFNRKRLGILVIHGGIILLLLGELVTALYAHEGNMTIDEGSYANYTEDIRQVELAVIDGSNTEYDQVVVVPESRLTTGDHVSLNATALCVIAFVLGCLSFLLHGHGWSLQLWSRVLGIVTVVLLLLAIVVHHFGVGWRISSGQNRVIHDRRLPFDVTIDQWMPNSQLFGPAVAPPGLEPKATAGFGRGIVAQPIPVVSGVEQQTVDAPSAYVTLSKQGKPLGTWLVSLFMDQPQPVTVGDKTYDIQLRFKREYKPYTMHLIDFRHDKFVGTETPRNFSSLIRLVDPLRNEDRQVLIYMNHPLRYAGETFYQSAFKPGDTGTILQVVRNPGWLLPYVSCTLVSLGMLVHFGQILFGFVGRSGS